MYTVDDIWKPRCTRCVFNVILLSLSGCWLSSPNRPMLRCGGVTRWRSWCSALPSYRPSSYISTFSTALSQAWGCARGSSEPFTGRYTLDRCLSENSEQHKSMFWQDWFMLVSLCSEVTDQKLTQKLKFCCHLLANLYDSLLWTIKEDILIFYIKYRYLIYRYIKGGVFSPQWKSMDSSFFKIPSFVLHRRNKCIIHTNNAIFNE